MAMAAHEIAIMDRRDRGQSVERIAATHKLHAAIAAAHPERMPA